MSRKRGPIEARMSSVGPDEGHDPNRPTKFTGFEDIENQLQREANSLSLWYPHDTRACGEMVALGRAHVASQNRKRNAVLIVTLLMALTIPGFVLLQRRLADESWKINGADSVGQMSNVFVESDQFPRHQNENRWSTTWASSPIPLQVFENVSDPELEGWLDLAEEHIPGQVFVSL